MSNATRLVGRFSVLSLVAAVALLAAPAAHAVVCNWDGDTSVTWATATNWDTLPANSLLTDIANFNLAGPYSGTATPRNPNAGTTSINGITIGASNGVMTLTTTNLSIGNGGITIASGAGALTVAGTVTIGAGQSWTNSDNDAATFGIIALGTNTLNLAGGDFIFGGANTGTAGTINLNGGNLIAKVAAAFGPVANTLNFGGGNLELRAAATTYTGKINMTAAGTTVTINPATLLAGVTHTISGAATLGGGQTMVMSAGSLTTIDTAYGLTLSGAKTLTGNSTYTINGNGTGAGTLSLTGSTDTQGATRTLTFNNGTGTGANKAVISGAFTGTAGILDLDGNAPVTINALTTTANAVRVSGTGTYTFAGTSTFTGGVILNNASATNIVTAAGGLGSTSGKVKFNVAGTTLDLRRAATSFTTGIDTSSNGGTITVEPAAAAAGVTHTLTLASTLGTNTVVMSPGALANINTPYGLTLSGANAFSAANTNATFTINGNGSGAGTLTLSGGFNTGGNTQTLTFNNGSGSGVNTAVIGGAFTGTASTLVLAGNVPVTVNALTGATAHAVSVSGSTTYSFNGANTFTGGLTIEAGTVKLGNAAGAGAGLVTLGVAGDATTGTLDLNGASRTIIGLATAGTAASQIIGNSSTAAAATLNYTGATTSTFGGVIQNTLGSGTSTTGLTVNNASADLTLSASSTYTGLTTITAGILRLGNASDTIADAAPVTVSGGTLDVANPDTVGAVTLSSGTISGVGTLTGSSYDLTNTGTISANLGANSATLTKTGAGTATLSGANAYTGATTVNGGTLDLGGGTATGSLASTTLNLGGGTFAYTRTGNTTQSFTTTNINAGASAITAVAGDTITLGTLASLGGSVDIGSTGTITTSTANTNGILGGWATFGGTTMAVSNGAGSAITGLGGYILTSVAGNTAATYAGQNIDVDSSQAPGALITPNSLRFNTAGAYTMTLQGANVITTGSILVTPNVGANLSTITGGTLAGAASGDLVVSQNNTNTGGGLTIASNIVNNTGATGLAKFGPGTLTLSGANAYTGGTTVNAGTLQLGDGSTTGSLSTSSAISVASGATFAVAQTDTVTQGTDFSAAAITGAGGFTQAGTGTTVLNAVNTYTGPTTITGGTLEIGGSGQLGGGTYSNTITISPGATFKYNSSANQTLSQGDGLGTGGVLRGAGSFIKDGDGTLTVSEDTGPDPSGNLFTGPITINKGTLKMVGGYALFNNQSTYTIASGAVLDLDCSDDAYPATGTTGTTLNGAGTLRFSSSVPGGQFWDYYKTAILKFQLGSGGLIDVQADVTMFGYAFFDWTNNLARVNVDGVFDLYRGPSVFADALTGAGTVTRTYAGPGYTLTVGVDNGSGTFDGTIASTVAFTKTGSGTQTLTGPNSFTGQLTVEAGTLAIPTINDASAAGTLGNSALAVILGKTGGGTGALRYTGTDASSNKPFTIAAGGNGAFQVDSSGTTLTLSGTLNNTAGGTITKTGAGALTISGPQTHGTNAILQVGGSSGGVLNMNSQPGSSSVTFGDSTFSQAKGNLTLKVKASGGSDSSIANLNAHTHTYVNPVNPGDTITVNDTHTLKMIDVDTSAAGTAKLVLGAGDPLGIGAGGTVRVDVYSGGTANGNAPARTDTESLWLQVSGGYYFSGNGITTNQVTTAENGLALIRVDNGFAAAGQDAFGAIADTLIEAIKGDVNGDFQVTGADVARVLAHQDTVAGTLTGEGVYTLYTWLEGDFNGDGEVTGADVTIVLANQDKSYSPGNGGAGFGGLSVSGVPEPGTFALVLSGLGAMVLWLWRSARRLSWINPFLEVRTMVRRALLLLVVLAVALAAANVSLAEMMVNVKVIGIDGAGGGVGYTDKTATIYENGTVTLGIYLTNINDAAGNTFGLGSYQVSVRSGDGDLSTGRERWGVGTSPTMWTVAPSNLDTVVNATGFTRANLGAGFDTGAGGSLNDINKVTGTDYDPTDTDIDLKNMALSQASGGNANNIGVGVNETVKLGEVTFTALDLDDITRPFNRTVELNTFFSTSGAVNSGLGIWALNSSDPGTSAPSTINLATAARIGAPVLLTVVTIPEPGTLMLLGTGLLGLLCYAWRRRR